MTPDRAAVFVDEQFVGHAGVRRRRKAFADCAGAPENNDQFAWISDLQH